MTPRGTPELDLRFRGVGRVRVSTGTTAKGMTETMRVMLRQLFGMGRLDILEAIRDKQLTPLQVYTHWRKGDYDRLPTAEGMAPLTGMTDWAAQIPNPDTRRGYTSNVAVFLRSCPVGATLSDLPRLLRAYRQSAKGGPMFNRTRMTIQSYLRQTLGKRHPLLLAVRDVEPMRETPAKAQPFEVADLVAATKPLGAYQGMAWTMALTGMRKGEYWGTWSVSDGAVLVGGGKHRREIRPVPYVGWATVPVVQPPAFARKLTKVAPGHTIHDLRATFMHWAELAGIPRSRRMLYMGHSPSDVSALYEHHEVEGFLAEDAQRLRSWLASQLPASVTLPQLEGV